LKSLILYQVQGARRKSYQ